MLARPDMLSAGEESLLSILACPLCKGVLARREDKLSCASCAREFARQRGYWSLLSDEARDALDGASSERSRPVDSAWTRWREALDGLESWRARAERGPRDASVKRDGSDDDRTRALIERALEGAPHERAPLVLDVGAKDGRMRALAPSRCDYLGIDPLPKGDGSVLRAVAEAIPVRDRAAQAVLCHAVFDYFVDPSAALLEMHRVLAAGGSLALVVSVVSAPVAHARGASTRVERVLGALRAARDIGAKGTSELIGEALIGQRAHVRYYTRAQVMALVGVRFDVADVREIALPSSTLLYVHGKKRTQRKLKVL